MPAFLPQSITNLTYALAFSCLKIPEAFLDKVIAKKHFSQFGKVRNITLRPSKYSCTVEYESASEAENAVQNGAEFNNVQFEVSLTQSPFNKPKAMYIDPDVQDELSAMDGVSRKSSFQMNARTSGKRTVKKFIEINDLNLLHFRTDLRQPKLSRAAEPINLSAPPVPLISSDNLSANEKALKNEYEAILRRPAFTAEEK